MLYNIGYTNTGVIYCHSTFITKVMLVYNTEWQYNHGMAVNYSSKKFYNIESKAHLQTHVNSFWHILTSFTSGGVWTIDARNVLQLCYRVS